MSTKSGFKKSRWVRVLHKQRKWVIFHSFNLAVFFVDREIVELLKKFKSPKFLSKVTKIYSERDKEKIARGINELIKEKIIIKNDTNELQELQCLIKEKSKELRKQIGKQLRLNSLRIILTEKCNFNCKYCFVKRRQLKFSKSISWEVLKKGINKIVQLNLGGHIELHFFGGEPLIEFGLIQKAVNYVDGLISQGLIKSCFYAVTTNGALINNENSKFFKEHGFLVSISIDGWEKLHNLNRKYIDGRETYRDTIRGLDILRKYKNDIGVLVTPANNTIKNLARVCSYIIKELHCNYITINTPQPVNGDWGVDGKKFSVELKKCLEIARKNNAVITSLGTRIFYALNEKIPLIFSCSRFENNFTATLTTNRYISPCIVAWHMNEYLTPIESFNYSNSFLRWKLSKPYYFKKCLNCPAINVCGGPCPLEIYEMKNIRTPYIHQRCRFFRDFLEWAIWYKL